MTSMPTVSVVMPVFNGAEFLDEAVFSILDQTFRDFEFIIIDDGSTDETASILQKYAEVDRRVKVFPQTNEGMIPALNRGCRLARGQYIARMDADDISLPHRLERQVEFLEGHPDIGIVGTWASRIDENGSIIGDWCLSPNPNILNWTHFFRVCVIHSTAMIRRDVLEKVNFYRPDATHAEDRDLWLRASAITEFSNVPEILLKYRVWRKSTSRRLGQQYKENQINLLALFVSQFLNRDVSMEAVNGLQGSKLDSLERIRLTAILLDEIYHAFICRNALTSGERKEISCDAAKRMGSLALRASRFSYREFMLLFARALRLNCRVVSPSGIIRGIQRRRSMNLQAN
jgi:glycosyltransferase involved in cell wall biosynthesis